MSDKNVLPLGDPEGRLLQAEFDQYADHLAICISWPDAKDGSPIVSPWIQLTSTQAVELAETIIGRWGSSDGW